MVNKNNFVFKIYLGILALIFGLIVLHAPLTVWLGTRIPDHDLLFKAWKEILMAVALVLGVWLAVKNGLAKKMWHDKLFLAIAAFALIHLILLALMPPGFKAAAAGLMIDLRYLLFFVLVYIALKLEPDYRPMFLKLVRAGGIIVIGFALLQIFVLPADILTHIGYSKATISPYLTVDKNPHYIRINSTLRGPNPLGAYVVIWLSLAITYAMRKGRKFKYSRLLLQFLAIMAGLTVLWATYSRSALAGLFMSLVLVLVATVWQKRSVRKWLVATAVLVVAVGGLLLAASNTTFVQQVAFHNNPQGGSKIDSNQAHVSSLEVSAKETLSHPLGSGVGSTGSASLLGNNPAVVENQYLFVAHESGWLGLLVFLYILVVVFRRLWRAKDDWLALGVLASGTGLALIGLLLPVWADDTVSLIWWGLAAVALATVKVNHGRKSTKQKTKRTS